MIVPIQKNRAYEDVAAQIRKQIEEGVWKDGDRIQSEIKLAELFQVSRGSVREAIKSLQMTGILEAHSGQGTFVAQNALQKIKDSRLVDMIGNQEYHDEILECRYIIEPQAAFVAARLCTNSDIEYLQKNYEEMLECSENGDIKGLNMRGQQFHAYIVGMMKNGVMSAIYDSISQRLLTERDEFAQKNTLYHLEHGELIEAFKRHDSVQARKIMERHIGRKINQKRFPMP